MKTKLTESELKVIRDALILIRVIHSPVGRNVVGAIMRLDQSEDESTEIVDTASAALEKILMLQVEESA